MQVQLLMLNYMLTKDLRYTLPVQ